MEKDRASKQEQIRELSMRVEALAREGTELLIDCPSAERAAKYFKSMVKARNALRAAAYSFEITLTRMEHKHAAELAATRTTSDVAT